MSAAMTTPARSPRALLTAAALFLGALLFVTVVVPSAITAPGDGGWSAQSPRFLPALLALAIAALSLASGIRAFKGARVDEDEATDGDEASSLAWSTPEVWRPLAALTLMLSAYPLSPLIGMAPAGMAISGALMILAGERRLLMLGLIGGGLSALIAYGFVTLLNVPLPEGMLIEAFR